MASTHIQYILHFRLCKLSEISAPLIYSTKRSCFTAQEEHGVWGRLNQYGKGRVKLLGHFSMMEAKKKSGDAIDRMTKSSLVGLDEQKTELSHRRP